MRKENKLLRINIIIALLIMLVAINIILYLKKANSLSPEMKSDLSDSSILNEKRPSEYYNLQCPEIDFFSTTGRKISIKEFTGDVIIIRFTRFDLRDLPYLLYLEHLYESLKKEGIHLLFIQLIGKKYSETGYELIPFDTPIIEDDGFISSTFQSGLYDTIIIGRDFRIKFKDKLIDNKTIYNLVLRFIYGDKKSKFPFSLENVSSLVKRISYRNLENGKIENLGEKVKDKSFVVNLSVSTCLSCPEQRRIRLMEEIASKKDFCKEQFILLFGLGNNFDLMKKFVEKNDIKNITVGIIQKSHDLSDDDYFRIFKLDIDPRIMIFDKKGRIKFYNHQIL